MHLQLVLEDEDKIRDIETIDRVVHAEIPNETSDKYLCNIVAVSMIHVPCSVLNPHYSCINGVFCSKGYTALFKNET